MPAAEDHRASPDALLAIAGKEGRGRLKIFLGASPGVGKTYAMLNAAQAERAAGRDVVAGIIETHGRADTAALLGGIPMLPRKPVTYRNRVAEEFDLDQALQRKPGLLLVDEYAHTNIPGSRHPKRWQDVEELLAAGIDVWTTLNIQHLESLNDVIQKITRIRVRETVPDSAFDDADEIILVDLPPDELLKRLAEGKVYIRETAQRAVDNFFKPQNLTALRELALRRAAERVDSDLVESMRAQAISGPWAAGERILACVGPDPGSLAIVRAAKRLADLVGAPWVTVTVERAGARVEGEAQRHTTEALRLAESLGSETKTLVGSDIPGELLKFARFENVTQIVIGRSHGGFLAELFGRSLPHEIVRRADDIAIHIITRQENTKEHRAVGMTWPQSMAWLPFVWATGAVALAGGAGKLLTFITPFPNLSIIFLLSVLVSALRFGIWPAVYASILSFLTYNFFFIPPLYTFTIAQPYELLALVIFLIAAILTSAAAGNVRDQARSAADRMRATRRLYEFTRRLSGLATTDAVAEGVSGEIHTSLGRPTLVLTASEGQLTLQAAWPPEDSLDTASMTAARWALAHDEPAGADTGTLPTVPWLFVPMRSARGPVGVIGISRGAADETLDPEARVLLDTLAEQAGAALDRTSLAREIAETRTAIETERIRNTLLASISHDFRTPLSSILGSATSLSDYGEKMEAADRADLLDNIKEEASRLDEMVRNLLSMVRIDANALDIRREWIDLADVVARVVQAAERRGTEHRLAVNLPADLPMIRADATLMEQAIANVIGNAIVHTPAGTTVTVDATVRPGTIAVNVTDGGPGIAPDLLPHVFEKFFRAARPQFERADGGQSTGLGLAITKGIVEAHGGSVEAQSPVAGGKGTRIRMTFPRGEASA